MYKVGNPFFLISAGNNDYLRVFVHFGIVYYYFVYWVIVYLPSSFSLVEIDAQAQYVLNIESINVKINKTYLHIGLRS